MAGEDLTASRRQLLETGVFEHQLKTEATIVQGWAATLDERWSVMTDEQKHDAVRIIRRRAEALAAATRRDLEDAARSWPPETSAKHDLAAAVQQVAEDMSIAATDHVVHYDGPASLECGVDGRAVEGAVQQLVENAAKYSQPGTSITVSLRMHDDAVVIEVVDEGVGIPAEEDLFAPFVRHGSEGGSGLGLFMVRTAVEAAGGNVTARRNERWGSTFRIEVPAT